MHATDITVREAGAQEHHALMLLAAEAVSPEARFAAGHTDRLLGADRVFVAESGHHLAGYVAIRVEPEVVTVDQLVVAVTDEGRGVGNRLLDWVEGYAISVAVGAVAIARIESDNRRAEQFYTRRGYSRGSAGRLVRELARVG